MNSFARFTALVAGLSLWAGGVEAGEGRQPPDFAELGIGDTAVLCTIEPCPWRGVFRFDDSGRAQPLSRENQPEPPPMIATEADRARIEGVYATHGCLRIEARFVGETLEVRRVLGECWPAGDTNKD